MFKISRILFASLFLGLLVNCSNNEAQQENISPGWPEISNTAKPWTRWWWMGSSVDKTNLSEALKEYEAVGLGGMEITPIYGVKGLEDQFITFTSKEWMEMLSHTLSEAEKLGLGVDMALASGWPFGGPWVNPENACRYLEIKKFEIPAGEVLQEKIELIQRPLVRTVGKRAKIEQLSDPINTNDSLQTYAFDQVRFPRNLPLEALVAYSDGEIIELTDKVDDEGYLQWEKQNIDYVLVAAFGAWHGKMVERAGPGGEGDVIDHFSSLATLDYLAHFDTCFENSKISSLRAFFNDSYEVDDAYGEANWTTSFFEEFEKRRGYRINPYLPALIGLTTEEEQQRVLCDYRETVSDLLLDNFTIPWQEWAKEKGKIIRNQAHGSPANILDLYAASDIPETEGTDILNIKFASSAAHVTGKQLVAAEAATWLNEHFTGNLAATKENVDRYLVGGVNHIVYHGTTYSPEEEGWPGRMFYASVHYAPTNPLWKDFPTLNSYVSRTQSFLQRSKHDNDILVYFPIYDQWMNTERVSMPHFHGAEEESETYLITQKLQNEGYAFDLISDKQVANLTFKEDEIITEGGAHYKTILVPKTEYIPFKTFEKLIALANDGTEIIFLNQLPGHVPGLGDYSKKTEELSIVKEALKLQSDQDGYQEYSAGKGKVFVGSDYGKLLSLADIKREKITDQGISYYRFKDGQTIGYFISNWSGNSIEDWIPFTSNATEVVRYDPMSGEYGELKTNSSEKGELLVLLDLQPGESCILQFWDEPVNVSSYTYWESLEPKVELKEGWNIEFVSGGPELPTKVTNTTIGVWNQLSEIASAFSGQATYSIEFEIPDIKSDAWKLSLGKVYESASIKLNEEELGTLIGPDYSIVIDQKILKKHNKLEITVSNLMANRILYMDKNNLPYRNFYNVNFAARLKENLGPDRKFTAVNWQPVKSGIEGPVELTPLSTK